MSQKKREQGGFRCSHCGKWVSLSELMGTRHRNQCPSCLWSQHVDLENRGIENQDAKREWSRLD